MDGFDLEVSMEFNGFKFSEEIDEFLCVKTLEEIDYGVLDLFKIKDCELMEVLQFFEELLTLELKVNYLENDTGFFRVERIGGKYYYMEFGHVFEADSICQLKELVLAENRIWYVFDYILASNLIEGGDSL